MLRASRARVATICRSFAVQIDKSPGQASKLTGYWTSKLPQELVSAMSQGEGDGDWKSMMRAAAENTRKTSSSSNDSNRREDDHTEKRAKLDAIAAATRGMDR